LVASTRKEQILAVSNLFVSLHTYFVVPDCYVAACGLPDPRKDHYLCMARFAREMLHKMHALRTDLVAALGPDTATLDLRVGMHVSLRLTRREFTLSAQAFSNSQLCCLVFFSVRFGDGRCSSVSISVGSGGIAIAND